MTFRVDITPTFVSADTANGIRSWEITFTGLPDIPGTPRQIRWATAIRQNALMAFARQALSGDDGLLKRHWWTEETQLLREAAQDALSEYLGHIVARATTPKHWIEALPFDRKWDDPMIVAELAMLFEGHDT